MYRLRNEQIYIKKDIYDSAGRVYIAKGKTITLSDYYIKKFKRMGILEQIIANREVEGNEENKIRFEKVVEEISEKYRELDSENFCDAINLVQEIIFGERIFRRYPHLGLLSGYAKRYYTHSIDVAILAAMLAEVVGYDEQTIKEIIIGAILHDIGVIFLSEEIIEKEDFELTEEEIILKQKHCTLGVMTMKNANIPLRSQKIIEQHHEKLDGTGYPNQLKEGEILEEAHLVSIIDLLDIETSYSDVKIRKSMQEAIQELYDLPEKYSRKYTEVLKEMFKV